MFKNYVIVRVEKDGKMFLHDTVAGVELVEDRLRTVKKTYTQPNGTCEYQFFATKAFFAYPI